MAALAMLVVTLAPAISHALHSQASTAWIEVCTAQGSKWIDADGSSVGVTPDPQPAEARMFEHCPFCHLYPAVIGMPPAPAIVGLVAVLFEVPRLFLSAPRTQHAWIAAQPRAPPSGS
jgi:hypothetical protein